MEKQDPISTSVTEDLNKQNTYSIKYALQEATNNLLMQFL